MFDFRDIRKRLGVSQSEMAQLIGVTPNYVSLIERGLRTPSSAVVRLVEEIAAKNEQFGAGSISVRDINGSGNAVGHGAHAANASADAAQGELSRLLALAESQQQTIAAQQATISALIERLK